MKMKKWFIVLMLMAFVFVGTAQFGNRGVLQASNGGKKICANSAWRAQLVRWLQDAERELEAAQKNYNWAVEHNTGVLMAHYRLLQAQRRVNECRQRLYEYDLNNPS